MRITRVSQEAEGEEEAVCKSLDCAFFRKEGAKQGRQVYNWLV